MKRGKVVGGNFRPSNLMYFFGPVMSVCLCLCLFFVSLSFVSFSFVSFSFVFLSFVSFSFVVFLFCLFLLLCLSIPTPTPYLFQGLGDHGRLPRFVALLFLSSCFALTFAKRRASQKKETVKRQTKGKPSGSAQRARLSLCHVDAIGLRGPHTFSPKLHAA